MRIEKKNMAKEPDRTLTLTKENFDFGLYVAYVGTNTTIANNLETYFTYALNKIDYAMITDPAKQAAANSTYWWNKTRIDLKKCD